MRHCEITIRARDLKSEKREREEGKIRSGVLFITTVHQGLFHKWGYDYDAFDDGPGNYTIGIVELEDGSIKTARPEDIKFTDK